MKLSVPRALLASLFAAAALSACSSGSSNNNTCSTAADCASGDTCVDGQCLAPGQCASGVLSCTTASQCGSGKTCTSGCCAAVSGCSSNSDCTSATKPVCNTSTHVCGACTSSSQCSTGKVCIVSSGACAAGCTSDSNCSGATPHCVVSGGFCAACTESSQCPSSAPFCTGNVCTGCSKNADCAAPTPVCDTTTKACVACLDSQNSNGKNTSCPAAKPACESGACVVCNPADNADGGSNGACAAATPSCGAASTCVACTQSSECTAGATCGSDNTCAAVALTGFAASAQSVTVGGTATFTATLNGDVTQPVTINVAISADGGAQGTLSAATIVISSGHTGTVTYTAPSSPGTANLTATLGATTLNASINVSGSAAALASVDLIGSSPVTAGSAVMATVTFSAAPSSDATVAVSVNNGGTINGSASANITVAAGTDVSAPFTVQLGCGTSATTITATYNGVTKTATVTPVAGGNVSVASLTASPTSATAGQPTTLTVTLTGAAGCGGTTVTLSSSDVGFRTESKVNTYAPGTITVPQGQTSAQVTVVPECTTNVTGDLIFFSAAVPGTQPVALSTAQALGDGGFSYTVAPIAMISIASGTIGLCPISPVAADRALNYVQADGGLAPLPTVLTVGYFASPAATGAYTVNLTANQAGGTACGTFTQDGGALPSGKLTLAAANKAEVTFLPTGVAGPCVIAAQGVGPTGTIYDAGVLSTLNLINYNWANQVAPTDLSLTKAEIDDNNSKVGTLSDGGAIFGDATEYVEVFNGTSSTIDLSQYTLVFVGSASDNSTFNFPDGGPAYVDGGQVTSPKHEMWSYALSGMLAPGAYAIAQDANTFTTAPANTTLLTWPDAGFAANVAGGLSATSSSSSTGALRDGNIANAPGGIFLVKNAGMANAKIVDGLSYGAPIQQAISQSITGTAGGVFSWPPAPLAPQDNWIIDNSFVKGSLVRIGYTGFPSLDWADSTTVTPGAPNNAITGP